MPKDLIHGELPLIDLDRLVRPVARIKLFGETHDVRPVDGRAADLLHQVADAQKRGAEGDANAAQTGLLFYDVAREIVASVVPTLTSEQRQRLTIEQMTSIIGIASKQVQEVEAAIEHAEGNGRGPATAEPTRVSPVPTPTTPSAPSSSASRGTRGGPSSKSRTTRMH